eukprot:CAMPEP_0184680848 /NCGR_PEP_ID=MMETSP0312-20130426/3765_1 /TAXON_ID=31354 /ORGANISM="Compsopogon coeruleus, Strain SAG 36.94" /LENGTH=77 /DNA_ID=CAMNT_0027131245 /DNA_START=123 /DNA_END=356 /DNA_ORIENTATION=+
MKLEKIRNSLSEDHNAGNSITISQHDKEYEPRVPLRYPAVGTGYAADGYGVVLAGLVAMSSKLTMNQSQFPEYPSLP